MAEGRAGGSSLGRTLAAIPREKQVSIAVLALAMLAGFGGLIYWANQPEFAVLYSDLDQSSAGSVVDQLDQRGVPYKLVGGGSMVQVPAGEVSRLRLALAQPPEVSTLEAVDGVERVEVLDDGGFRIHHAAGASPAEALARRAVESGWGLRALVPEEASLEQIFVDLTLKDTDPGTDREAA